MKPTRWSLMRRCRAVRLVTAILVVAALGVLGDAGSAAAQAKPSAHTALVRTAAISLVSDGLPRTAIVHVPATGNGSGAALVVALHGSSSSGHAFEAITGFDAVADRERFIVVYPDGLPVADGSGAVSRSWNSGGCCPPATTAGVDDVAFISDLIDYMNAHYAIDPARVYVVGHSNGAIMAQRVGCVLADRIAAIASVSGALDAQTPCHPAVPVSMLEIHGTNDPNVDYANAPRAVSAWRQFDQCPNNGEVEAHPPVTTEHWAGCARGSSVEFVTIDGGGHPWPGTSVPALDGAPISTAVDATTTVWTFFATAVAALRWEPTISTPPAGLAHGQRPLVEAGFAFLEIPTRLVDTRGLGVLAGGEAYRITPAVPADATSAVVTVTVVDPVGPGYVTVYPCTTSVPNTSIVNFAAGEDQAAVTVASLDADGGFCVATSTRIGLVVDLSGFSSPTATLRPVPVVAHRVLDTRQSSPLQARTPVAVTLPSSPAAVMLNVTVANATHDGYLTVYPTDSQGHCASPPSTSNVNFRAGAVAAGRVDVASHATAPGSTAVCAWSSTTTDLIMDQEATYDTAAPSWIATPPARIFDSRATTGPAQQFSLPVPGGAAVGLTITAIAHDHDTYVSIWPAEPDGTCHAPQVASLANPPAGQARANSIVVDATHHNVCAASNSPIDLVVDLIGTT